MVLQKHSEGKLNPNCAATVVKLSESPLHFDLLQVYNRSFMNTLSRSEKIGIGAIALGAALNVPVWYAALSSGEKLQAEQNRTSAAVQSALTNKNTSAANKRANEDHERLVMAMTRFDQQNDDVDTGATAPTTDFTLNHGTAKFAGAESEWWQIKNICVNNPAWYCGAHSNGVPPPTISIDYNPPVLRMPVPPPQSQQRRSKPTQPAQSNASSNDPISKKLRQLQMDNMSDFLDSATNGLEAMTQSEANLLLMLLNDVASDQLYAADFLRNQNTNCQEFIQRITGIANRFSTQIFSDPEAGSPTPRNLAYATWLYRMQDIGFTQSPDNSLTWEFIPSTLLYCNNNTPGASSEYGQNDEFDDDDSY